MSYQPQPYGPTQMPQYPMYGGQPDHPQAQTVFILGIVGVFVGIIPFVAWYMGSQAKKEIEAGAPYIWGGNLKTGYLLGKIFGIIHIVVTVLYIATMGCVVMLPLIVAALD